ncbi:nitroreductase family protein [Enterocloster bolteae]|uniref:nitroreductase family protein n=1 Tax=Enterocloster bolteae TaxID=208479 RepID=UPI0028DC15E5|nr:nitroreductase family protein [Enterocloster bolteae]
MENELYELARKRRSIRKFTGEKVDGHIVDEILKTALTAPSSWGRHPVEFVVVRNKEMIQKIAACKAMGAGPLPYADVAVIVMADTSDCELWIEDSAVASAYILLAAEQYDIGACWIHIRGRAGKLSTADEEIRMLLGIPDRYSVLNAVALGHKGEMKRPYGDEDLCSGNIHYEMFGKRGK